MKVWKIKETLRPSQISVKIFVMTKRALIHVDDTENIVEFAQFLTSTGWTIVSANKTEELLRKNHVTVTRTMALSTDVAYAQDITRIINDVVATRIPDGEYQASFQQEEQTNNIFIVCINITPFYDIDVSSFDIKTCDYRISSILRYAFYNYENVLVLTDPKDYKEAILQLRTDNISPDFRLYLAQKALNLVAAYDSGISHSLAKQTPLASNFPLYATYPLKLQAHLKQGSNKHQLAGFYTLPGSENLPVFENCSASDLDYLCLCDVTMCWEILNTLYGLLKIQYTVKSTNADNYDFTTQFTPLSGKVFTFAVKFNNLLSASLGGNILESFAKTYTYDLPHIRDAVLGSTAVIDGRAAEAIINGSFIAVIAPDFTKEAKKIFTQRPGIKLIYSSNESKNRFEARFVYGGFLIQQPDKTIFDHWYIKTRTRPSQIKSDQLAFGMLLALKTRSYSVILIKDNSIAGIAQGCVSVEKALGEVLYSAREHAVSCGRSTDFNPSDNPVADVLICDEKIHFGVEIKALIDLGVSAIIETGGTLEDNEFINYCEEKNVSLIFTGITHISL